MTKEDKRFLIFAVIVVVGLALFITWQLNNTRPANAFDHKDPEYGQCETCHKEFC